MTPPRKVRAPSVAQIDAAARTLARAANTEAQRLRDVHGPSAHVAAQELEHDALRIVGLAARLKDARTRR